MGGWPKWRYGNSTVVSEVVSIKRENYKIIGGVV
jgi:hypothetical protein